MAWHSMAWVDVTRCYIAWHCITLPYVTFHNEALYCIALGCTTLHYIALHSHDMTWDRIHCITLQYIPLHPVTVHHITSRHALSYHAKRGKLKSCHITSCRIISYQAAPWHTIPYGIIPCLSCHTMPCIPQLIIQYPVMPYYIIACHPRSGRSISCCSIWAHNISYHIISHIHIFQQTRKFPGRHIWLTIGTSSRNPTLPLNPAS